MESYEKLGAFYLGRLYDLDQGAVRDDLLLYEAKDLTTHAVCVGMTGSGKTGLCLSLIEEAAIDGIPTIAIDPKGDLGNLLLAFPKLRAEDFRPWVDDAEAERKGQSADEYAATVAALWKKGLADWGQDGERIGRFVEAVDVAIYTPGSSAGLPLQVLRSFAAPPPELLKDGDALRERIGAAASGLLALLGIEADPIQSREHILISNLLQHAWQQGNDLDIAGLIRGIQQPSFSKIGVMDLESFYPTKDRLGLSMSLNNLLASPGFAAWMEGEPLEIKRLLWNAEGKPRISILSIAHLSETERMFFVTLLLNEVLAWIRTQAGTSSLRAILYMDEVFGYFPPVANPPSKMPMLTLLKQARAFGLGVVLATQNPVDLDYKGLSNAGTWLLGRLQTERDKARVLEGLEGASAAAGAQFDRGKMDAMLAGLKSRVFLMNNVHDDEPALFHTRWVLSYLRGPLTRTQIQTLMEGRRAHVPAQESGVRAAKAARIAALATEMVGAIAGAVERPILPAGVEETFLPWRGTSAEGETLIYRPLLLGEAKLHFVQSKSDVDVWRDVAMMVPMGAKGNLDWLESDEIGSLELESEPGKDARFEEIPAAAMQAKSYTTWGKELVDHLYRTCTLDLNRCPSLREVSEPGESEGDFRARLSILARERRDTEVEKLEKRYAPKLAGLQERIRKAEARLEREQEQYGQQKMQTAISIGATVLGALLGRKVTSARNVGRATTAARGVGRAAREKGDVARASEDVEATQEALDKLEAEFQDALSEVRDLVDPAKLPIEPVQIRPRKSDLKVGRVAVLWAPWRVRPDGTSEPAFDLGDSA